MHQDDIRYGGRPQPRRLCVRWGPSFLPQKGQNYTIFGHIYCGQTAAWIKMPLGTEVGLRLRDRHCVRCGPSYPEKKGTPTAPNFWRMSIEAKRLNG